MSTSSSQAQKTAVPSTGAVSTPNKTPPNKHFRGGVVTAIVGPDKKEFTVHRDLLVFYSDYFRAAFNGSFIEATNKKIDLLDVNQEVFEHFITWLYTRKIASDDDQYLGWDDLVNLWVFGDQFQVPMLQNCVMDELFAKGNRSKLGLRLSATKPAYEKTAHGSPLRKAIIELLVYRSELANADFSELFTFEILQDIMRETIIARKNKVACATAPKRDKCFFHVHGKDEHC
ncbi:hypothetical protein M436DRAFT_67171 [Aureobasidium namibiae CBS 147.97]|uniref:BTB domain-containing protein n=1 Tax=Aureobasidium namibiae CBS 147.97 TaxID=1043004 RepID=A0A074WD94_9PEZI|nr:uncharacterized protein M436DRAFT_67171 [Aureobasidium namibiae CBS 147.97]KEQ69509.1 hypothetical protein M436DRAFT_67171 [Aureobasidium namibiae CBS 147.97]